MKLFKMTVVLALALCLCASAGAEEVLYSHLGETLPDFSVSTIDGGTFTLSETLKEKDLVMINLWATWCGPCEMEFPYMEEAYEQYKDKVEIIALSVEPEDSDEVLTAYAEAHGMTFPIANGVETGLGDIYATQGIPTTLVIDRFGAVAFIEVGAQTETGNFTRVFDFFIGDEYTETQLLYEVPPMKPNVEPADEAELSAALNAQGSEIVFRNPEGEFDWPFVLAEKDGRATAVASSNGGCNNTSALVNADLTVSEGQALAFDFAASTESGSDVMSVIVDGERVKAFGGEHPWTSWIIALPAGAHELVFTYEKDAYDSRGEDCIWLDEVRLVSGEVAERLFAELPVYPTGEAFELTMANPGARKIVFEGDDDDLLGLYFYSQSYWIVPDEKAEARITLPEGTDPEAACIYSNSDGVQRSIYECMNEEGNAYFFSSVIDSMETTGYSWTNIYAYPGLIEESEEDVLGIMFFANEENVNAFVDMILLEEGVQLSWHYADGSAPATEQAAQGENTVSTYVVTFVDQNGDPVPGCVINFCTDEACVPTFADENGVAVFEGAPYAYHLQVIKVPAGYEFDTAQEFYAEEAGGEMTFTVTKK